MGKKLFFIIFIIGLLFIVGCAEEPAIDSQSVEDVTEEDLAELPEDLQPKQVEKAASAGQAINWHDCQDPDSVSTYDKNSLLTKFTTTFTGGSKTDRCYTWYKGTPNEKTRLIEGICRKTRAGDMFNYWYVDCEKLGSNYQCVDGACINKEFFCTESDKGLDFNTKGTTYGFNTAGPYEGESVEGTDKCIDNSIVLTKGETNYFEYDGIQHEITVDNFEYKEGEYNVVDFSVDGQKFTLSEGKKFISSEVPIYLNEIMDYGVISAANFCIGDCVDLLREFHCQEGDIGLYSTDYECENGCLDGICCPSLLPSNIPAYGNLDEIRSFIKKECFGKYLSLILNDYSMFYDESDVLLPPVINEEEKVRIYGLANIFWLENNDLVPWSIESYSKDESEVLFFVEDKPVEDDLVSSLPDIGFSSPWHLKKSVTTKEFYKITPLTLSIIEDSSSQLEAVEKIVLWLSKNLRHYFVGFDEPIFYRKVETSTFEDVFNYRTAGCHQHNKILISMLRSVNIPAYEIHLKGHGVIYIPTLDVFVHGDVGLKFPAILDADMLIMNKDTFVSYAISDVGAVWEYEGEDGGEFRNAEKDIRKTYLPYSSVGLFRSNDDKLYLESISCSFSEEDITDEGEIIKKTFLDYDISFEESTDCIYSEYSEYSEGTHRLISNQIPIKGFNELLNELK